MRVIVVPFSGFLSFVLVDVRLNLFLFFEKWIFASLFLMPPWTIFLRRNQYMFYTLKALRPVQSMTVGDPKFGAETLGHLIG
jgi:hypothetical protein